MITSCVDRILRHCLIAIDRENSLKPKYFAEYYSVIVLTKLKVLPRNLREFLVKAVYL